MIELSKSLNVCVTYLSFAIISTKSNKKLGDLIIKKNYLPKILVLLILFCTLVTVYAIFSNFNNKPNLNYDKSDKTINLEASTIDPTKECIVWGYGTYFETTNSSYLNVSLASSEMVYVYLTSNPERIDLHISPNCSASSTILTFSGLNPNSEYYLYQDGNLIEYFISDINGQYTFTQDIYQGHHIQIKEEQSTIYISPDGSLKNSTGDPYLNPPISIDPTFTYYTLTKNIYEQITIQRNGITLDGDEDGDGNGDWYIQGTYSISGVYIYRQEGITVKNLEIKTCLVGIDINYPTNDNFILNNTMTDCKYGVEVDRGKNQKIEGNTITNSWWSGIGLSRTHDNKILDNTIDYMKIGAHPAGIRLFQLCDYNTIDGNTIIDVIGNGYEGHGIFLDEGWGYPNTHNIISNNFVTGTRWRAIYVYWSGKNTIYGNTVKDNGNGIWLERSKNCLVYHNNIFDLSNDDEAAYNKWYHPTLLEGNYWWGDRKYTGVDDGSGEGKHAIAGDGIGDTKIPFMGDYYPFIQESGWLINYPPIADVGISYESTEGTIVEFDASGSTDFDGDPLQYRWDFDNDGSWEIDWNPSPIASYTWYDDHIGTVAVEVSDGEFSDDEIAAVTIYNVDPSVNVGPDITVDKKEPIFFSPTITDPGDDSFTYSWDFESDGTPDSDLEAPIHVYSEPGIYTVSLEVFDDDGGIGTDTCVITVSDTLFRILIDDTDPTMDWEYTKSHYSWCTGGGTPSDPYIIEGITVDGEFSVNCIEIRNSMRYFIIRNCEVMNSANGGFPDYFAGIKLINVQNGIITGSTFRNNEIGLKINGLSDSNLVYDNQFNGNTINAEDNSYRMAPVSYHRKEANQILGQRGLLWGTAFPRVVGESSLIGPALSTRDNWNLFLEADYPFYWTFNGLLWQPAPNWVWIKWGDYGNFESDSHQYLSSIQIHYRIMAEGGFKPFNILNLATLLTLRVFDDIGNYQDLNIAPNPQDQLYYDTNINKVPWNITSGPVFDRVKQGGYIKSCALLMYCYEEFLTIVWLNIDFLDIVYHILIPEPSNNQWDNGTIGNYWADYDGMDMDDDGIGDTPYFISGTAGSQDNFPIWDDGSTPVANDDSYSIDEDEVLTISIPGVMGNDFDANGDLSYVIVDVGPLHGSLILNTDGSFTYIPEDNYNGDDTFTYIVYDTLGAYDYGAVNIIVNAVDDPPVAIDALYSVNEDEQLNLLIPGILANVLEVDGDPLNAILVTDVSDGTLTLNPDGSFLYIPDTDFYGDVWFEYKANDGSVDSNTAIVTINVVSVNDAPVAIEDEAITNEDTAVTIDLLANDYDIEDDPLNIIEITGITSGEVFDNGDGTIAYSPALDFVGIAIFDYTISDGQGGTAIARCSVTVLDTTPPETTINYIGAYLNLVHLGEFWYYQDVLIELSPYDAGVGVSYTEYSFNNIDWITYTVPFNVPFEGNSSIYYRSEDNYGNLEDTLNSTIHIIYTPFVIDDGLGSEYTWFDASMETWCDGSGTEFDPYIIENLVISGDIFTEICIEILNSEVYFTLRNCTLLSGQAGVLLLNVNNSVLMNNYFYFNADGVKLENSFWNNITLNYFEENKDTGICLLSSNNNTISNCTLYRNLCGIKLTDSHSNIICYNHLKNNKHGIDMENSHYNDIHDNTIISLPMKRVIVAIKDIGCYNYISSNTIQGCEHGIELINSIGTEIIINTFIENDVAIILSGSVENKIEGNTFLNNDDYAVVLVDNSIENSVFKNQFIENNEGDVQAYDDSGSNHWTDENGIGNYWSDYEERYPDTGEEDNTWEAAYEIDGDLEVSDEGSQVNPPPVSTDDTYSILEDDILIVGAPGVMENDYDAEGDLSYMTIDVDPLHGTLTFDADGSFTYVPEDDYNGDDTFTYIVYDAEGAYDYGTVIITIIAVNDDPLAYDASYYVNEDEALNPPVPEILTYVYDVDGDPLNFILVTDITRGMLTLNPDGSFLYIPEADFYGDVWFEYKVNDGSVDSNTAIGMIVVISVNDAPIAYDDTITTNEDISIDILLSASDIEGDDLLYLIVDAPLHGVLSNPGPNVVYTPEPDYYGADSFTFKVNDEFLDSNIATISININSVNDAPVANDDTATTDEDVPVSINVLVNDYDVDGDGLTILSVETPSFGTAVISAGSIDYTPEMDYNGYDSFIYTISDGNGGSDTATITVEILDKTAPTTTLSFQWPSSGFNPTYISTNTKVELEAKDNTYGTGVAITEYQIDTDLEDWLEYTAEFSINEIGSHTIFYRSFDIAGNIETTKWDLVVVNASELTYEGGFEGIYSDPVELKAKLTEMATGDPIHGKTIDFTIGDQDVSAVTESDGFAYATIILNQIPGDLYTVSASFAGDIGYLASDPEEYGFIIKKEHAYAEYTGDMVVPVDADTIMLRVTVFDENDGNWGDLTQIYVTITILDSVNILTLAGHIYNAVPVKVTDVEGVGVAELPLPYNLPEGEYLVQISFELNENDYYLGEPSIPVALIIYKPEGDFVTGGGWIEDENGNKGNFGFNVKYKKNGIPKGQAIYVYRDDEYVYIIKANAWVGMAIVTEYNYTIFEAKCNIKQINRLTGEIIWEEGNYRLVIEAWDHSQNGKEDVFQVRVYDKWGIIYYESGFDPYGFLGGGNIVIHTDKKK